MCRLVHEKKPGISYYIAFAKADIRYFVPSQYTLYFVQHGLVVRHWPRNPESRVRIPLLPPDGFVFAVWWSQVQLLHALQIVNWPASYQVGFLTSFC